jgi:hypothetical protein
MNNCKGSLRVFDLKMTTSWYIKFLFFFIMLMKNKEVEENLEEWEKINWMRFFQREETIVFKQLCIFKCLDCIHYDPIIHKKDQKMDRDWFPNYLLEANGSVKKSKIWKRKNMELKWNKI